MFIGFTPETVDFLWGIRWNNNREWFTAHKKQYTDTLYEPMKALGKDLFQPFLEKSGSLLKVSRIYRDARLHPPTPYKDSLWVCIRQDVPSWEEAPCLYFEINPEGVDYGFSVWKPKPATMEAFRRRIAAKPEHGEQVASRKRERQNEQQGKKQGQFFHRTYLSLVMLSWE